MASPYTYRANSPRIHSNHGASALCRRTSAFASARALARARASASAPLEGPAVGPP